MTVRNVLIALTVVVAAVVAGALWYDAPAPERTAPEAALISALADDLAAVEPGDPPIALAPDDATCVAEGIVDGVGVVRLAELSVDAATVRAAGFDPSTVGFAPPERDVVVDAFDACVDLTELAVDSLAHTGGQAAKVGIDEGDRRIIDAIAPRLRRDGLFFVGIDVIGGLLTEINVTSPTGIQEMSRLDGVDYPARVLDRIEERPAPGVEVRELLPGHGHEDGLGAGGAEVSRVHVAGEVQPPPLHPVQARHHRELLEDRGGVVVVHDESPGHSRRAREHRALGDRRGMGRSADSVVPHAARSHVPVEGNDASASAGAIGIRVHESTYSVK